MIGQTVYRVLNSDGQPVSRGHASAWKVYTTKGHATAAKNWLERNRRSCAPYTVQESTPDWTDA